MKKRKKRLFVKCHKCGEKKLTPVGLGRWKCINCGHKEVDYP